MKPATRPPEVRDDVGLVVVDPPATPHAGRFSALPDLLAPGDVLVVNDAATFPGSLAGQTADGAPLELRLIEGHGSRFRAAVLGAGDWRTDTDQRPPPPPLTVGDPIRVGDRELTVVALDPRTPRLVEVDLGPQPWNLVYRFGRPIQYSYLEHDLALWSVQTSYGSRPVAAEMPSAGRPLTGAMLDALRSKGVAVERLTHAAGLSATGDPDLDGLLPLPERYDIPNRTAEAVTNAPGRVLAMGTTVVRALESAARRGGGRVAAGTGLATLVLGPETPRMVVDGLVTGLHDPSASHWRLLEAFADAEVLEHAWATAERAGFRSHELGDVALVWSPRSTARLAS